MSAVRRNSRRIRFVGVAVLLLSPWAHLSQVNPQGNSRSGTLEGFVRVSDASGLSATRVENTTDPTVCGQEQSLEDVLVASDNRGLANATVVLLDVPSERIAAGTSKRVELANRDCRFEPHVSAVTVGDTIVTINSDPTLHTTHYYGALRGNVSLPYRGMTVSRVVREAGTITVLCDVHGWMRAYIHVYDQPFFAVSDSTGHFRISGVPAGTFNLEIWHEVFGTRRLSVHIEPDMTSTVTVVYDSVSK